MNLAAFPIKTMDFDSLRQIIAGGLETLKEAGVALVGGHGIEDKELKYGLSVTGFVHPDKLWSKHGLKPGDQLILTKPIGSGIINTAIKGGLASDDLIEKITRLMSTLNLRAAETLKAFPVHACTDITGFGLLGHLAEMVCESRCSLRLQSSRIPILEEAMEFASIGLFPAGAYKNKEYRLLMVEYSEEIDPIRRDILFDPQTSGGLLFSIPGAHAEQALKSLHTAGCRDAVIIGEVIPDESEKMYIDK